MTTGTRLLRRGLIGPTHLGSLLLALSLHAPAQVHARAVEGEIVVQLRARGEIAPLLVKHQLSLTGRFGTRPIFRLKVIGAAKTDDKIKALLREPDVRSAEPNVANESPEERKNLAWAIGTPQEYAADQWALKAIHLAEAHRHSKGAGMRIAVLDTGVNRQHPALVGRLLPGFDFVDFDADPSEAGSKADRGFGHGTHVAGLVALVAPDAHIMPLRVLDAQGAGNVWVLTEAMLHAADPDGDPSTDDGAHVINLSLGALGETNIFKTIAKLVTCKKGGSGDDDDDAASPVDKARCGGFGGAVVVAAAGNRGSDKIREYPAAETSHGLLAVGASDRYGGRAPFSNFGWVKLAAPGEGITSAAPGGGYETWGGTSMSAPLVAGAAALMRAADHSLSIDKIVQRLKNRTGKLCDTKLRQLDIAAAIADESPDNTLSCTNSRP